MSKKKRPQAHAPSAPQKVSSPSKSSSNPAGAWYRQGQFWLPIVVILLLTTVAYWSSLNNEFTNWDDQMYVTENPNLDLKKTSLKTIFTTPVAANIHPFTMLSYGLDYTYLTASEIDPITMLKEPDARVFHRTSLWLHLINSFLVFWLIYLISNRGLVAASIAALIFALHPMHVESVSWISGRKDVMYGLFFLLSFIAYHYFKTTQKKIFYTLALLAFVVSCFSKAMAVPLPILFILYDLYRGHKLDKSLIINKLPFFAIAIWVGIMAFKVQSSTTTVADFNTYNIFERMVFACYGLVMYMVKFIAPVKLSTFYPYPIDNSVPLVAYASVLVCLALGYIIVLSVKKQWKHLWFGAGIFFFTVALVLQFVNVGEAVMADRYTYLPYLGLGLAIGIGVQHLVNQNKLQKNLVLGMLLVPAFAWAWLSHEAALKWKDSGTLWANVVTNYDQCATGFHNLGHYYRLERSNDSLALLNYNKAIALDPNYFECLANRGAVYRTMKQYNLAIADYNAALSAKPNYEDALTNRANVYFETGKYQLAINDCSAALVSKPNNSNSLNTRAGAYLRLGEAELEPNKRQLYLQNALADYSILIAQNIRNSTAFTYRAYTYFLIKNKAAALNDIDAALAIDPKNQQAAALKQSILILN